MNNFFKITNKSYEIVSYESNSRFYTIFNRLETIIENTEYYNLRFDLLEDDDYFGIEYDNADEQHTVCALRLESVQQLDFIKKLIKSFNI